ncbi:MAG: DUF4864 domain-containing protein [Nitrospira sp.]|jgi:uncharacterized membrane protein YkvA (DUF1232 family)|nr:DUF4864 domain-containing protein [Nitrospira sp.]
MLEKLRSLGRTLKREVTLYQLLLQDQRTPILARFLLLLAVGYLLLPFDLIPDFIPVIGQLDDVLIVPGLVLCAFKLIPAALIEECRLTIAESPVYVEMSSAKALARAGWWRGVRTTKSQTLRILAVLSLLGVFGLMYWWGQTLRPVGMIRAQLQAIEEGEYWRAYNYLSATARETLPFAEFVALIQENSVVMEPRDSTFSSRKVDGDTAIMSGVLEGYSEHVSNIRYVLVKEHDEWKIASFEWGAPRSTIKEPERTLHSTLWM